MLFQPLLALTRLTMSLPHTFGRKERHADGSNTIDPVKGRPGVRAKRCESVARGLQNELDFKHQALQAKTRCQGNDANVPLPFWSLMEGSSLIVAMLSTSH
jgi:hypothetical protein